MVVSSAPREGARAATTEDAVSASYSVVDYESALYRFTYGAIAVANQLWLAPGIELGAGGRIGFGNRVASGFCWEAFGAVSLVPHFGMLTDGSGRTASWRPSAGLELGYSAAHIEYSSLRPLGSGVRTDSQPAGAYVSFAARPLRFRFTRFDASVIGLVVGTPLVDAGRKLRVQIEVLQIGLIL
jgi:hypothetical protein